jgi:hypothetical protein
VILTSGAYDAFTGSIFVSGFDVYVAGYEYDGEDGRTRAKYWKNGREVILTNGAYKAFAESIFVSGSDVYVAGHERDGDPNEYGRNTRAKYWKNGREVSLTSGAYNAGIGTP